MSHGHVDTVCIDDKVTTATWSTNVQPDELNRLPLGRDFFISWSHVGGDTVRFVLTLTYEDESTTTLNSHEGTYRFLTPKPVRGVNLTTVIGVDTTERTLSAWRTPRNYAYERNSD